MDKSFFFIHDGQQYELKVQVCECTLIGAPAKLVVLDVSLDLISKTEKSSYVKQFVPALAKAVKLPNKPVMNMVGDIGPEIQQTKSISSNLESLAEQIRRIFRGKDL
jgi:hypothetical protein